MTRFKICCISSVEEAALAVRAGASALGFVSAMPSGAGIIEEELIAEIIPTVPPGVSTFLLTCSTDVERITEQQRHTRANTLQLVDAVAPEARRALRSRLPGIAIVQVVHVQGPESVDDALASQEHSDAILLDSGNPSLAVKELGGTGRVHDWSVSARIRERVRVPLFLAGGLHPGNVASAIRAVRPYGVDICSGLRPDGRLDAGRLGGFVQAIRDAG